MNPIRRYLPVILALAVLAAGCTRKKETSHPGNAVLKAGTGAILVVFPGMKGLTENWMSQAVVEGSADTRMLPRMPMAELKSLVVLNVLPGTYRVYGHAWFRGGTPEMGGGAENVSIREGRITILRAFPLGDDRPPYTRTRLQPLGEERWDVGSPAGIQEFLAGVIEENVKG